MSSINLELLSENIRRLIRDRQMEWEKKGIHKNLEEIYQALMAERLKTLQGNVKKDYPCLSSLPELLFSPNDQRLPIPCP